MSFPYLDLAGFQRRALMPVGEIQYVETDSPGFVAARIAVRSSWINGRLRKRYGNRGSANSLPFGQGAPTFIAAGTAPPAVQLSGTPVLGSMQLVIAIPLGGVVGLATFKWSQDGGATYSAAQATASSIGLPGTGLTANFSNVGTYSTDNVYAAATPVPEIVLGWLTTLVVYDVYRKRGVNMADPLIDQLAKDVATVEAEVKEAADSKDGLFDIPTTEDGDSAITTGGPLAFSDASPYAWQDRQGCRGRAQDARDNGPATILGTEPAP